MPKIPFLDLVAPHEELKEELTRVFQRALETGAFVGGPAVAAFESEFAAFCGTQHCVGVSSGTDALRFALIAAGIGPGAAVVTVPNTFIATAEAITQAGARPVFVDIDERTYHMDPRKLAEYLERGCYVDSGGHVVDCKLGMPVRAIVPVHLYGQPADMDPILELAERYCLVVIEDACQAHGAEYLVGRTSGSAFLDNPGPSAEPGGAGAFACHPATPDAAAPRWRKAGSMGRAGAFSFYPGKNLGACGEAGAVTTDDAELARNIRMLRDHGQARKYYHEMEGYNGRLDAIQAGILSVKLKHLADWNAERREAAARYRQLFDEAGVPSPGAEWGGPGNPPHSWVRLPSSRSVFGGATPPPTTSHPNAAVDLPYEPEWAKAVYHLYVIRVQEREAFMRSLAEANIGTAIHYPVPLHLQEAYRGLGYGPGDFPVTERVAAEIVSLPMFPQLTGDQQARVVACAMNFLSTASLALAQPAASH